MKVSASRCPSWSVLSFSRGVDVSTLTRDHARSTSRRPFPTSRPGRDQAGGGEGHPGGLPLRHLAELLFLAVCAFTSALTAQQPVPQLVGTWRVVEFCNVDSPGDTTYSLGRGPIGFFLYDPAGNLSIQAMRAAPAGAFTRDSVPLGGMAELRTSYFGYFGTYTITSDSTVVHHVTGGTIPSYVGTAQRRNYRIRGDTLSIGSEEPWACRKLVRVR